MSSHNDLHNATLTKGDHVYIHEEIQRAVLPLLKKYDLELIDLIGEMNHAAWEMSVLNRAGIEKLVVELKKGEIK